MPNPQKKDKFTNIRVLNKNIRVHLVGFTLIELLIVVAILGVLASLFTATFPAAQRRARDTTRKSDTKQYQTAVEVYANKNNGSYPIHTSAVVPSSMCVELRLGACPDDPKNGQSICSTGTCQYNYVSNAGGTEYSVWMRQEAPNDTTKPLYIICSNGKNYDGATAPTSSAVCP